MSAKQTSPGALPPLREVIAAHGLNARKRLGQHFLLDLNLTAKIARAAGPLSEVTVLEVGPGPGGLTRALLSEGAKRVIAVERDPRCIEALKPLVAACPGRLEVLEADALTLEETTLPGLIPPVRIVANLPYNISTALLVKWLATEKWPPWYDNMTLMFQKEVAERLQAHPGTRTYGRLSVLAQWRCQVHSLFDIPARAFTPPPKVDSSLVHLTPRAQDQPSALAAAMMRVTAAAFGQRRKMLRSSLRRLGPDSAALLEAAGLDPTQRAEQIDIAGYERLARALMALDSP